MASVHTYQIQKYFISIIQWKSKLHDPKIGYELINARAETVAEKPSFRAAFRQRRCLIPADGFYEWQQVTGSRQKQPYFISLQDERPFAFAGLYERWNSPDGENFDTCTILTTAANEAIAPIHNRMPVILAPQEYAQWLDLGVGGIDRLPALLDPYPVAEMKIYPVSSLVNSPKNDSLACKYPESITRHWAEYCSGGGILLF